MDLERLEGILTRYDGLPADLIPVLQEIQDSYNYLPKDELKVVAERLNVPLTQIYSVATFYKMFSLVPKGKPCLPGLPGHHLPPEGRQRLAESVSHRLGVDIGYTTKDMNFTLETVGCLGSCAQAPVMMIDDTYFARVTVDKVPKIPKHTRNSFYFPSLERVMRGETIFWQQSYIRERYAIIESVDHLTEYRRQVRGQRRP